MMKYLMHGISLLTFFQLQANPMGITELCRQKVETQLSSYMNQHREVFTSDRGVVQTIIENGPGSFHVDHIVIFTEEGKIGKVYMGHLYGETYNNRCVLKLDENSIKELD